MLKKFRRHSWWKLGAHLQTGSGEFVGLDDRIRHVPDGWIGDGEAASEFLPAYGLLFFN